MLDAVKHKIVFFWLTHSYLRRIGKRYPEYFKHRINDLTDNLTTRKIMIMRYTGDTPLNFETIAIDLNMDLRNVFKHHKKVIDKIISGP